MSRCVSWEQGHSVTNHITMIEIRNFINKAIMLSSPHSVLSKVLTTFFLCSGSHSAFSVLIWNSSQPFFLSWPWHSWRVQASYFAECLSTSLCDISLWLESGYTFSAEYCRNYIVSLVWGIRAMMAACPNTGNVSFDHLVMVARFTFELIHSL